MVLNTDLIDDQLADRSAIPGHAHIAGAPTKSNPLSRKRSL
jgi:hypothetical protein